jgi:hypothetical protein
MQHFAREWTASCFFTLLISGRRTHKPYDNDKHCEHQMVALTVPVVVGHLPEAKPTSPGRGYFIPVEPESPSPGGQPPLRVSIACDD